MPIDAAFVKATAKTLGADLCGIASIDRFPPQPQFLHPQTSFPECRSVIVLANRFLKSTFMASAPAPYTVVRNLLAAHMDQLSWRLASALEAQGLIALPTGAVGPVEQDPATQQFHGLISLKMAGALAGLGRIGKNSLLINDQFGNMIWLSAVMTDANLEADPLAEYDACPADCRACLKACPVQALNGTAVDQLVCYQHAFGPRDEGQFRIRCFRCREACPSRFGLPRA